MRRVRLSDLLPVADPGDPEGFRASRARIGPEVGADRTGASLYEIPPGQAVCPYHYEHGEEEWVLVLAGRPSVRTPEGVEQLEPLELVFFPMGPDGAHQVRNDTDAPARILMWSTVAYPAPDLARGGSLQGILEGLNRILDITAPEFNNQGGTLVIPGHGRISNESDVAEYRDMTTIIRDRIQDMIDKGMTIAQVKAARPTKDYDGIYSTPTWTGEMFVETVYKDLARGRQPRR